MSDSQKTLPFYPLKRTSALLISSLALTLAGCGGSSSSDSGSTATESEVRVETTATLGGVVFASSVGGASVSVYDASGNLLAGPASTDAAGLFSMPVTASVLASDILITSSGGSFADEATGSSTAAGEMMLFLAAGEAVNGQHYALTPESTIIGALVRDHSMTAAAAKSAFEAVFGYLPDPATMPADATIAPGSSNAMTLAGLRAAAFSQLTQELGLSAADQFALLTAIAEDIADGQFNGMSPAGAVSVNASSGSQTLTPAIFNRYVKALLAFKNSDRNKSGLNDAQLGGMPLATVAESTNYHVTYANLGMSQQGKSQFTLTVTGTDGIAVPGLTPVLVPLMNMAMHTHGTPHEGCTTTDANGMATCTLYYLMASEMMNGDSMGYWSISLQLGDDHVTFTPPVMMAMGDTVRAVLKGVDDTIPLMSMAMNDMDMSGNTEPRSYYLFNDGVVAVDGGRYQMDLFVAAKNSMNDYPPVATNGSLLKGSMPVALASVAVELSLDGMTWMLAEELGSGHYRVSDINGLQVGIESELQVRLSVNAEQKTTDGSLLSDANGAAIFFIKPR